MSPAPDAALVSRDDESTIADEDGSTIAENESSSSEDEHGKGSGPWTDNEMRAMMETVFKKV